MPPYKAFRKKCEVHYAYRINQREYSLLLQLPQGYAPAIIGKVRKSNSFQDPVINSHAAPWNYEEAQLTLRSNTK